MEKIYHGAHIVVLPTFYGEGVPTTLIEAAASGRAIVATELPGCCTTVHHERNCLLVPPNDAQALAQAVARLSQHPALREKMGAAGRKIVLERFTHKKINQATTQVYRHLLDSKKLE
jgi:glycosyltransferase involved in cell wall biosynthesis